MYINASTTKANLYLLHTSKKVTSNGYKYHVNDLPTCISYLMKKLRLRWLETILMWLLQQQLTMQLLASCQP